MDDYFTIMMLTQCVVIAFNPTLSPRNHVVEDTHAACDCQWNYSKKKKKRLKIIKFDFTIPF